jgi:hypothetical protein
MPIVSDERVIRFVSEVIGVGLFPPQTALGIEKDGQIIAGAVFNCFEGAALHVTVAGHGWTKGFCTAVGEYVFWQLGYERMTVQTEHPEIVRFAERLGGRVEGLLENQFGRGRHAFIVGILADNYKFKT